MQFSKKTLSNGLRIITVPFENMESATVTVWSAVGSRQETPQISGLAHFLEHMVFKGSSKRPTAKDISEAVDGMGAEFNAGTTKEWTDFYIKCRSSQIASAFDVLSDMVLKPHLREEDIEREKGVILEEISMYEDNPAWHVSDLFEQLIFQGSELGRDIIGTRETVMSIKRDNFVDYRAKHYHPENILITVSGGVKEKEVVDLATKYFGDLKKSDSKHQIVVFDKLQDSPRLLLKNQKKEQAHLVVGFLGFPKGHATRYSEAILSSILGGGMSSRLFTEIREKRGLAYSVRTSSEHYVDTGYIQTYAGVDLKRVDEAIEVILDQTYGLTSKKYKITKNEFERSKEYIKGHLALSLEDTRAVNHFFGEEELLLGKLITPEEVFEKIDKVTVDEVLDVANKLFVKEKLNFALIGPYDDKLRFEKLIS